MRAGRQHLMDAILNLGIGLLYIILAAKGQWFSHTLATFLLRLTFLFCGLGHLSLVFLDLHFLHIWANAVTVFVGLPTVYRLVFNGEKVIVSNGE